MYSWAVKHNEHNTTICLSSSRVELLNNALVEGTEFTNICRPMTPMSMTPALIGQVCFSEVAPSLLKMVRSFWLAQLWGRTLEVVGPHMSSPCCMGRQSWVISGLGAHHRDGIDLRLTQRLESRMSMAKSHGD